ncbi:hypothetical protein [Nocardioides baekrokdamisoli]|nr:hypothetical protein [Nocardioides baekrokdamisoli]
MTFNGLPLHVLVVHLTVVTLPALVLVSLVSLHPRWRDRLRIPAVGLALFTAALVWFTVKTGESFQHDKFPTPTATLKQHIDAANTLKWVTYGFAAFALVRLALHRRSGVVRLVLSAALIVGVVALGYFTFKTGEAGARDSYGGYYSH